MSLLDVLANQASIAFTNSNGQNPGFLGAVTQIINNPEHGGLSGLINSFKEKGLGETVQSWISTGHNLPISAEQIKTVLGSDYVQSLAHKFGLSTEALSEHLATVLPQAVDHLTPQGQLSEVVSGDNDLLSEGLSTYLQNPSPKGSA